MHEDPPSSQSLPSSSSFFSRLIYFLFSSFISFAFLDLLPSGQCLPNFLRRLLPPRELYGASEKANATEGRMKTKRWIYQYLYLLTPLRFRFHLCSSKTISASRVLTFLMSFGIPVFHRPQKFSL